MPDNWKKINFFKAFFMARHSIAHLLPHVQEPGKTERGNNVSTRGRGVGVGFLNKARLSTPADNYPDHFMRIIYYIHLCLGGDFFRIWIFLLQ